MFALYQKRSVELTLFRYEVLYTLGRNRQAHAVLAYSMNIARWSLPMKITSFRNETFSERYVICQRGLTR